MLAPQRYPRGFVQHLRAPPCLSHRRQIREDHPALQI